MANTCFTSWFLVGLKADIKAIHDEVVKMQKMELQAMRDGYSLEYWSLYTLLTNLGAEAPVTGVDYRMEFMNAEPYYEEDGNTASLLFGSEDAWGPKTEGMALLKKRFPNVRMLFSSEENGNEQFWTNDKNHIHFTSRFIVDASLPDGETEYEEFPSEKELVDWVNGTFAEKLKNQCGESIHVGSIEECGSLDGTLEENNGEGYFHVYKIKVDNDSLWLAEVPGDEKTSSL